MMGFIQPVDIDWDKNATITAEFAEWVNHNYGVYRDEKGVLCNHVSMEGDSMSETLEYIKWYEKNF